MSFRVFAAEFWLFSFFQFACIYKQRWSFEKSRVLEISLKSRFLDYNGLGVDKPLADKIMQSFSFIDKEVTRQKWPYFLKFVILTYHCKLSCHFWFVEPSWLVLSKR